MARRHERPHKRVIMMVRGTVRNDPRVVKEARTLVEAGFMVIVVAMKLPGESRTVERMSRNIIAVRTTTGYVQRVGSALRWFRPAAGPAREPAGDGATPRISRFRLGLMLVSRSLLGLKMARLAVRARPDVLHAHDFSTLPAGWLAARATRAALIYDAHEVNVDREGYYRQLRWLISRMERFLVKRCDRLITTTELRARHYRRYYRLRRSPVVLQNRPPFAPVPEPRDLRARFGIPERSLLCIYQGGLQVGRGLHNLICAVAQADCVHCVLVGGGHQELSLKRLAGEMDVAGRVHFHPKVALEEVAELTASADVGIQILRNTCFNHWSTDSNKLFEYALAGVPVVASNFPEIRRVVEEHDIGLLVDPRSVKDVAGALERLRDNLQLRCRLKRNAVASARALSWESQAPALLSLYSTLSPSGERGLGERGFK